MAFSPVKTKKFVRHVIQAAHKQVEKEQINLVQKALLNHPAKFPLEDEFRHIDNQFNRIIKQEDIQISNSDKLKNQIKELEHDLSSFKSEDSSLIAELKEQVKHLESELHKSDKIRFEEVHSNKLNVNNISRDITDLRKRFHDYIVAKNDRDLRVQDIENRIKQKVGKNYDEILKLEKQLALLEEKLAVAKTRHRSSFVNIIEEKIKGLKHRLIMKKSGVDLPKLKISKPPVTPNLPSIRHDVAIKPIEPPVLPPPPKPHRPGPPKFHKSNFKFPKLPPKPHKIKPIDFPPPPPFPDVDSKLHNLTSMEPIPEKLSFFDRLKQHFKK